MDTEGNKDKKEKTHSGFIKEDGNGKIMAHFDNVCHDPVNFNIFYGKKSRI
ncbi:MAG: hypothetical protein ACTSRA_23050 [Promethearchaeota archaeon]